MFYRVVCICLIIFSCTKKENSLDEGLYFEGLKIKHRFSLPIQDFTKNNKSDLEKVKKIIIDNDAQFLTYTTEKIVKAINAVSKKFPYPTPEKPFNINKNMIIKDFPQLSISQLSKNKTAISRYYDMNFSHEVLRFLKTKIQRAKPVLKIIPPQKTFLRGNCTHKMSGYSGVMKKICIARKILDLTKKWDNTPRYSFLKIVFALSHSNTKASFFRGNDNPSDAKRHIYGSLLLAKYYLSLFADKNERATLSKLIGTINEKCGDNYVDSSAMDIHNNDVGIYLFNQQTIAKADNTFFIPSDVDLKKTVSDWVDAKATKIDSEGKTGNLKICHRKDKILNFLDKTIPVYLNSI